MMAVTLFVLVWLYPRRPGLMFGLAAALLFPGSLIRFLPHCGQGVGGLYLLAFACFAVAAWLCRQKGMEGIGGKGLSEREDSGHA